jgi:enoyl-CoA hydratase/carnithine racemase
MTELSDVLDRLVMDPPTVLSIRGGGERAFVSGGDLKDFRAIRALDEASAMAHAMRSILDRTAQLPSIVIAELNGHALGGGAELAIAADFRVAAEDIQIGFSQITLGITPAWGGIERLVTLIGRARAVYLISTGTLVSAAAAERWGLLEEVVPRETFDARCIALRESIAARPAAALRGLKAIACQVRPPVNDITATDAVRCFAESWVSEDHWSAVSAQAGR